MTAYYNENDSKTAVWLRELIKRNLIAPGDVDERNIEDVKPDDLRGYTQCHFFAGIGGWSYALRLADWPDDRPVWTGSCPCQPFSVAGKGAGFTDERHLWPAWHHLILHGKERDVPVFGEQVASKDGLAWLDLVQTDLEGSGYACWPFDICAAGIGAPHIRQRLYFMADNQIDREWSFNRESETGNGGEKQDRGCSVSDKLAHHHPRLEGWTGTPERGQEFVIGTRGLVSELEYAECERTGRIPRYDSGTQRTTEGRRQENTGINEIRNSSTVDFVEYAEGDRRKQRRPEPDGRCVTGGCGDSTLGNTLIPASQRDTGSFCGTQTQSRSEGYTNGDCDQRSEYAGTGMGKRPRPTNGHWTDTDWLLCRDGKWRPVESGTFPLADGVPARVGRLRGYGNAIVPQVAAEIIKAYCDLRRK